MATVQVRLSKGKFAQIDEEDLPLIGQFRWNLHPGPYTFYAVCVERKGEAPVYMHRLLMGVDDPSQQVDHKDGDGLNNTRQNLRIATQSQNAHRSRKARGESPYRGVFRTRSKVRPWESRIRNNGPRIRLGSFATEEEAAKAYDKAARDIFGEFAAVNFPSQT